MHSVHLPDLCHGSTQDCSTKTVGSLVLVPSTKKEEEVSTDQLNHERYRYEVFLPFIQKEESIISIHFECTMMDLVEVILMRFDV